MSRSISKLHAAGKTHVKMHPGWRFLAWWAQSDWVPHLLLRFLFTKVSDVKEPHDSKDREQDNGTDNACRICRIRIQLPLKAKILGRTTDDGPDVRPAFRIIAQIARGARLTSRALGAARTGSDRRGAGTTGDACDIGLSWQHLRIPWSNLVNKAEEVCSMLNSRPTRIIVASSYVWLANHCTSNVSMWALPSGRNITCCDIEVRPVWDGSSLRDVARVPEYIRYRQRWKGGTYSARSGLSQAFAQFGHLERVVSKRCRNIAVQGLTSRPYPLDMKHTP